MAFVLGFLFAFTFVIQQIHADCAYNGLYLYSQTIPNCLRNIALEPNEATATVTELKKYFSSYAFRDINLNLPGPPIGYGGQSINIFDRLDEIAESATNLIDFYQDITQLVNSLHCAHTLYQSGCLSNMIIVHPYTYSFKIDPITGKHYAVGGPGFWTGADAQFTLRIVNSTITYVNVLGLPIYNLDGKLNEGTYTPEEAVVKYGDEYEQISRNPYAREEIQRTYYHYVRRINTYPLPKSVNQTFQYIDRVTGQVTEASVPYLFYAQTNIRSVLGQCPVNRFYTSGQGKEQNSEQDTIRDEEIKKIMDSRPKDKKERTKYFLKVLKDLERKMHERIRDILVPFWREQKESLKKIGEKAVIKSTKKFDPVYKQALITPGKHISDPSIEKKKNAPSNIEDFIITYMSDDQSLLAFYIPSQSLGIIRIPTFSPDDYELFQWDFYQIVRMFADKNSRFYAKKLLLDLRYNGGGYARLPPIVFQFLFPQADSPIWPPMDVVKAPINSLRYAINDYYIKEEGTEDSEIQVDEKTGELITDYFQQEGYQRTTSIDLPNGTHSEITVNLTKRAVFYAGHADKLREYSLDWKYFRSVHWQRKDVFALANGYCISACAVFAKAISAKKVGRTIALGNFGGVHNKARFNFGTAGGSSVVDNEYIEYLRYVWSVAPDEFFGMAVDGTEFPDPFYRNNTLVTYVQMELYGQTPKTSQYNNEFYIYDADFHINWAEQYYDVANESDVSDNILYRRVIQELNQKLGIFQSNANRNSQGKGNDDTDTEIGCAAGDIFINTTGSLEDCKSLEDQDLHAVYGYKCSSEDETVRNIDTDEIETGEFIKQASGCIFSHCQAGYNRENGKCVAAQLFYGEEESQVRPPYLEPTTPDPDPSEPTPDPDPSEPTPDPDPTKPTPDPTDKEPEPEPETPAKEEKSSKSGWLAAGIIFIVLTVILAVGVVAAIIFTIFYKRNLEAKNKEEQQRHSEELEEQRLAIAKERQRSKVDVYTNDDDKEDIKKQRKEKKKSKGKHAIEDA